MALPRGAGIVTVPDFFGEAQARAAAEVVFRRSGANNMEKARSVVANSANGSSEEGLSFKLSPAALDALAQRVAAMIREDVAVPVAAIPEYLNVDEATDYIRASSRQRIYDLVSSGRLARYKDGSRLLVRRAELDAYLQA